MGSDAIRSGDVIAGRYRLGPILSRSRGLLFEGIHTDFDQRVVIRVLPASMCEPKEVRRFQREARILTRLESEHVARLLDVGTLPNGALFYVRPYLEGADLDGYLKLHGALPLDEATLLILQAAEAVAESHVHGYVIRELSPSRLFLTRRAGGEPLLKVIDFGTAKLMRDPTAVGGAEFTATSMFGLSCYSSPEVVRKLPTVDSRADIWSLGAIFYHMLAGRLPFDGEMAMLMLQICRESAAPLTDHRADIPAEIAQSVERAMAKEADFRFPNVHGFAQALAPFASSEGMLLIQRIGTMTTAAEQRRKSVSSIPPDLPLVHAEEPPREPKKSGDRDSSPTLIRGVESIVQAKRAREATAEASRASAATDPQMAPPAPMDGHLADHPSNAGDGPPPVENIFAHIEGMLPSRQRSLPSVDDLPTPAADASLLPARQSDPTVETADPMAAMPMASVRDVPTEERVLIDLRRVGPASGLLDEGSYGSTPGQAIEMPPHLGAEAWSKEEAGGAFVSAAAAESQRSLNLGAPPMATLRSSPQEPELPQSGRGLFGSDPKPAGAAVDVAAASGEFMPSVSIPKVPPVPPVPPGLPMPPGLQAPPVPPRVPHKVTEVRMARAAFASALVVLLGALGYTFFRVGRGKSDQPAIAAAPSVIASDLAAAPEVSAQPAEPLASAVEPAAPSGKPLEAEAMATASAALEADAAAPPATTAPPAEPHGRGPAPGAFTVRAAPAGAPSQPSSSSATPLSTASPANTGSGAGPGSGAAPSSEPAPAKPAGEAQAAASGTPSSQAADSSEMGTLIAVAIGGSCAFAVNDAVRGTMSTLKSPIKAGTYVVSCTPSGGAAQSKSVTIPRGGVGMATFKIP